MCIFLLVKDKWLEGLNLEQPPLISSVRIEWNLNAVPFLRFVFEHFTFIDSEVKRQTGNKGGESEREAQYETKVTSQSQTRTLQLCDLRCKLLAVLWCTRELWLKYVKYMLSKWLLSPKAARASCHIIRGSNPASLSLTLFLITLFYQQINAKMPQKYLKTACFCLFISCNLWFLCKGSFLTAGEARTNKQIIFIDQKSTKFLNPYTDHVISSCLYSVIF